MEHYDEHHQMCCPAVHVPDQLAEADTGLQVLHVAVGGADRRGVDEHEVYAGDEQDSEEHSRDESETERIPQAQHAVRNLHGVDVQEDVAERLKRSPAWR